MEGYTNGVNNDCRVHGRSEGRNRTQPIAWVREGSIFARPSEKLLISSLSLYMTRYTLVSTGRVSEESGKTKLE